MLWGAELFSYITPFLPYNYHKIISFITFRPTSEYMNLCLFKSEFFSSNSQDDVKPVIIFAYPNHKLALLLTVQPVRIVKELQNFILIKIKCPVYFTLSTHQTITRLFILEYELTRIPSLPLKYSPLTNSYPISCLKLVCKFSHSILMSYPNLSRYLSQ